MKKAVIGGFLTLSGSVGLGAVLISVSSNMAMGWTTPPGRILTTVLDNGALIPLIVSLAMLALGLVVLAVEYFRK